MRKLSFLGLAALLLGIGAALAFTTPTSSDTAKANVELWYMYVGGSETDGESYQLFGDGSTPPSCQELSGQLCAIKAQPSADPQHPIPSTESARRLKP